MQPEQMTLSQHVKHVFPSSPQRDCLVRITDDLGGYLQKDLSDLLDLRRLVTDLSDRVEKLEDAPKPKTVKGDK